MIEMFKMWINSLLCLGIFTTILGLIMPNSKLKKYIYSLIGVLTIITVIYPVINIVKNKNLENEVTSVLSKLDKNVNEVNSLKDTQKYEEKSKNVLQENFKSRLKEDVLNRLNKKGIIAKRCDIFLDDDYNIDKIEINIKKIDKKVSSITSVTEVVKYLNEEYDISFSKISVVEEG